MIAHLGGKNCVKMHKICRMCAEKIIFHKYNAIIIRRHKRAEGIKCGVIKMLLIMPRGDKKVKSYEKIMFCRYKEDKTFVFREQ